MIDPLTILDRLAVDAQRELDELVDLVEAAKERRAIVFARANEQGRSSGDLARLLPAHGPDGLPVLVKEPAEDQICKNCRRLRAGTSR